MLLNYTTDKNHLFVQNTQNTSVIFEVKEYGKDNSLFCVCLEKPIKPGHIYLFTYSFIFSVLPKFSVSISGPKYVLPNMKVIGFSIEAKYACFFCLNLTELSFSDRNTLPFSTNS